MTRVPGAAFKTSGVFFETQFIDKSAVPNFRLKVERKFVKTLVFSLFLIVKPMQSS